MKISQEASVEERLDIAIKALRVIALSYRERIMPGDLEPYEYAQNALDQLGIDLEGIMLASQPVTLV